MNAASEAVAVLVAALNLGGQVLLQTPVPQRLAMICFYERDEVSGMNKICYYNCGGSSVAITVANTALCRLSINR